MITYKLHFIRTGITASSNSLPRCVGQTDLPLAQEGVEDLERLLQDFRYPRVEKVFTSPLLRCRQTAGILYPDAFCEAIEDLQDLSLGCFEGRDFADLGTDADFAAWLQNSAENTPPGGEPLVAFMERIIEAVKGIFFHMVHERVQNAAVITHGGVIRSVLAGIGLPKRPVQEWICPNGMGYTVLFSPQMWMRDGCAEVFHAIPEPVADAAADSDYLEVFE